MDEDLFSKIIIKKMTKFVNGFSTVDYERSVLRATLNDQIAKFLTSKQLKASMIESKRNAFQRIYRDYTQIKRKHEELKSKYEEIVKKQKIEAEDLGNRSKTELNNSKDDSLNESDDELLLEAELKLTQDLKND